jgi:hypothetical protein
VIEMMLWGNGNTVDFIMTLFSEALSTAKSYLRIEVRASLLLFSRPFSRFTNSPRLSPVF